MKSRRNLWVVAALPVALVVGLGLVLADGSPAPAHRATQTFPIQLGTSGGNVNDRSRAFCCSGTLGSLVDLNGTKQILSNNHVLARADQAAAGEDISQPGLIEVGCNVNNTNTVANFTSAPTLGSQNVDAAIAAIRSGAVDTTGAIIDVGIPSSTTATPAVGQRVAKSGRTTGLTCGSISSVNTNVSVQYQKGCNQGKKFVISYSNQVVISSSTFSAGGDSGSLIVTADQARPVALLFAGSSTTTIGNPIGDVLAAFPGMGFVGGPNHGVTCPGGGGGAPSGGPGRGPHAGWEKALAAKNQHADNLMADPAVIGVGVGADNGEAVVVIYVEEGRAHGPLPLTINGVRTLIVRTDAFRAYGWNEKLAKPGTCSAR